MNTENSQQALVHVVAVEADGANLNVPIQDSPTTLSDIRTRSVVVAADQGTVSAGYRGSAIAGFGSTATALTEGLAYVLSGSAQVTGHAGIAVTRGGGTAHAVDLLAVTYQGGNAIMEGGGIAIAINGTNAPADALTATARASTGGLLIFGYFTYDSENNPVVRYVPAVVDGVNIIGGRPYKLDSTYQVIPA